MPVSGTGIAAVRISDQEHISCVIFVTCVTPHPHGDSQTAVTLVPGNPTPISSGVLENCTYINVPSSLIY